MASQKLQETTSYLGLLAKHRVALLTFATMLAPTLISAQTLPGTLDSSFGKGGKLTGVAGGAIGIQQDGKIVTAGGSKGDFSVARLNPNGTLDATFGSGGKVTTDFGGPYDAASSVAIRADGKIIAAGTIVNSSSIADFAVARYNPNGTLDTTFGSGGKVTTDFGGVSANAYSIAIQRDGKVVVAGVANIDGGEDFALARYNLDGTPDSSFGTGGRVVTDFGTFAQGFSWAEGSSVVVQADGKIVMAGDAYIDPGFDIALARYNPNGSLDTTFGTGGKVTTNLSANDRASSVGLQADGKIVTAGQAVGKAFDFALLRYNSNGTLDTTFGTGGKVLTDFADVTGMAFSSEAANSVAIRLDGKIVAVGRTFVTTGYNWALARYNSNGTLDTSFGKGGKVTTDFAGDSDEAGAVAVQPDGKTVVSGYATINDAIVSALVRYN